MERTIKSFAEFTSSGDNSSNESANENKSCMSEATAKKLQECMEAMENEMQSCHDDETENTAETYMKECEGMMKEMMEKLGSSCESIMEARGPLPKGGGSVSPPLRKRPRGGSLPSPKRGGTNRKWG